MGHCVALSFRLKRTACCNLRRRLQLPSLAVDTMPPQREVHIMCKCAPAKPNRCTVIKQLFSMHLQRRKIQAEETVTSALTSRCRSRMLMMSCLFLSVGITCNQLAVLHCLLSHQWLHQCSALQPGRQLIDPDHPDCAEYAAVHDADFNNDITCNITDLRKKQQTEFSGAAERIATCVQSLKLTP